MNGEKGPPFEMISLHVNKPSTDIGIEHGKSVGGGSEVEVSRATLRFEKYGRTVDGLVLKKIRANTSQTEWSEQILESILEQWRYIKAVNLRREKEKKSVFKLPGTVRGYREGNDRGIVTTDLTKGGKNPVYDLKDIGDFMFPGEGAWKEIRTQIERDLAIAEEEGVFLGGGPYPLDPWLVVFDRDEGIVAYLSDIGGYTSVKVSKERAKESTFYVKRALDEKEKELFSR